MSGPIIGLAGQEGSTTWRPAQPLLADEALQVGLQDQHALETGGSVRERLESERRLTRELAALEKRFRSILKLRHSEDLEPTEIATRRAATG